MILTTCGRFIGNIYAFLWIGVLFMPYIYYEYVDEGGVKEMFDQLTWWCWTVQTLFYTLIFVFDTLCCRDSDYDFDDEMEEKSLCPQLVDLLSVVTGTVWFVSGMFIYVLFSNPLFLVNRIGNDIGKGGIIHAGNILVHYYIVTGIYIWSLFRYNNVQKRVTYYFQTARFAWFRVLINWLLVLIGYLCYWGFDFEGISKQYHINDEGFAKNLLIVLVIIFLTITSNLVYFSGFTKDIEIKDVVLREIPCSRSHRSRIELGYV